MRHTHAGTFLPLQTTVFLIVHYSTSNKTFCCIWQRQGRQRWSHR